MSRLPVIAQFGHNTTSNGGGENAHIHYRTNKKSNTSAMKARATLAALGIVLLSSTVSALELPKEVTPAIRAACEKDVRRLCIKPDSTVETVKACVKRKFRKLNARCKIKLVQAGL